MNKLLLIGIILIAVLFGSVAVFMTLNASVQEEKIPFVVHEAESLRSIATRLEQKNIIRSLFFLEVWSRLMNTTTQFRKGEFFIPANLTTIQVHDFLLNGKENTVRITIPEGYTIRKTAAKFEEYGITTAKEFVQYANDGTLLKEYGIQADTTEGFLYPETYFFPLNYPAKKVVLHMIDTFFTFIEEIYPEYRTMLPEDLYDIIILASIIEREYRTPEESPLIASVFYNRLNIGMKLQSCATVVYVMTEEDGLEHPKRLFYSDLERNSPYNTYVYAGLPPGPIASPGRVALHAAMYPAQSDYWFFVLRGRDANQHYFSSTLSEHSLASLLYLKSSP